MFKNDLSLTQLNDLAAINFLVTVPLEVKLISNLYGEMERIWGQMRDQYGEHLIERNLGGGVKSDGVRDYAEKLTVLVFNSIGSFQRGLSKKTISDKNDEATTLIRRVPAYTDLTNEKLFKIFMINLFGYDEDLIAISFATNDKDRSKLLFRYILNRFDIVRNNPESEELMEGFYPDNFFEIVSERPSDVYQECFTYVVDQGYPVMKALQYYASSLR